VIAAGEGAMSRAAGVSARPHVVVIGVSTGGPEALEILLPDLPGNFPLPVLVVQHMPEIFTQSLAERLDSQCFLRVREVRDGELLGAGTVHVARGNWHMEVLSGARTGAPCSLHLTQGPPENHCRPAVDVVLRSAVQVFGAGVLAVQLTGMGADGLAGCRAVHAAGGVVLAQDKATSVVWGMPGAVVHAGLAHRVLPIEAMAREILRRTSGLDTETVAGRETVVQS
jgi:two-component system chemotaxis response regulator CheB